ncbi:HlyD family secretion protein, partial [Mesorhizobium sp. M00.F.Ca.ET.149.01.1.1]
YNYWTDGRFMIATDDAYVQADMSFVSPKISGYIDKVLVSENQQVKAGDPLFVIDNGDYKIAVGQAEAQIATLAKTLDRIDAQTKAAQASLSQAQAQKIADQAAADNAARAQDRAAQLLKTHVGTQAQLDDAQTALDQAKAALVGADAQIAAAQANIGVLEAQRAESASTLASLQLTRDKAKRDLSFTVLKAPYDGVVGNRSVEQGDLVSPGQKLAVVVPMDKLYIVGNFKETQLGRMVPGEKVRITVDAIDGQTFEGTVSSLAPASGAVFSLLPPENATGNFTKVVQRVPVRIDVPADVLKTGKLRAGLSVVVAVDSRTAPASTTN